MTRPTHPPRTMPAAMHVPLGVPARPRWLTPDAVAQWRRVLPFIRHVLTKLDGFALAVYCSSAAMYLRLRRDHARTTSPEVREAIAEARQLCVHHGAALCLPRSLAIPPEES